MTGVEGLMPNPEPELLHRLRELAKNARSQNHVAKMDVLPSEARDLVDLVDRLLKLDGPKDKPPATPPVGRGRS